ncbi:armadillo-like helical domain-containing protein 3 [Oscarella lobularis]|uniref:armadillo-like helical domain-containing protein 3 n=1 Tax=Oscarella lobularis TaxID=121494 RepID=UPI0033136A6B
MAEDSSVGKFAKRTSHGVVKEKFVTIYERLFAGADPSEGRAGFWDELFLLKVNVVFIEQSIDEISPRELLDKKDIVNSLFVKCVEMLRADRPIRVVNALQTLCALVRAVFRKIASGLAGFDVIDVLVGFNAAETEMQSLISRIADFLSGESAAVSVKNLALKFLLVLVTATDNVSENTMIEYLMMNSVFEAIVAIFASPSARQEHGYDALLLLTVLVNYRKYEAANPYILKLSVLDDEIALNGLGVVLSSTLTQWNRHYVEIESRGGNVDPATGTASGAGFFYRLTSFISSMFVGGEQPKERLRMNEAILLALYEAVHLNRNFITVLTQTHSSQSLPSPAKSLGHAVEQTASILLHPQSALSSVAAAATATAAPTTTANQPSYPVNLLGTFLTYTSIALQSYKGSGGDHSRLCLITLTCIVEDQYANSFIHDPNIAFKVTLQRAHMRHRATTTTQTLNQSLASTILDLMVETLVSHLAKNLSCDLYARCLGIIHRLLCYQKRCRVRLPYHWQGLWSSLISVVKFLVASEAQLVASLNLFALAHRVVSIFNLFITYGDTFLPSPTTYDELYYELIRVHQVFENLYAVALRHSTTDGAWKTHAAKVANDLINIRAIVNHFVPKIDSFSSSKQIAALTPEQVLEVVRINYDTLTLKLQDNLDHYEKYSEKPYETTFFTSLMRSLTVGFRKSITLHNLQQSTVIQELATIE